jgi:septal ring factor EnvC (AmiA/AmiB activator)
VANEREKIEAELNMSELDRLRADMMRMIEDLDEIEKEISDAEDALNLTPSKPTEHLFERLRRIGMSETNIANLSTLFDAIEALNAGREISPEVRKMLAEQEIAAQSAAEQLAAIVESRRK